MVQNLSAYFRKKYKIIRKIGMLFKGQWTKCKISWA
jgi:hypothetical protein